MKYLIRGLALEVRIGCEFTIAESDGRYYLNSQSVTSLNFHCMYLFIWSFSVYLREEFTSSD